MRQRVSRSNKRNEGRDLLCCTSYQAKHPDAHPFWLIKRLGQNQVPWVGEKLESDHLVCLVEPVGGAKTLDNQSFGVDFALKTYSLLWCI